MAVALICDTPSDALGDALDVVLAVAVSAIGSGTTVEVVVATVGAAVAYTALEVSAADAVDEVEKPTAVSTMGAGTAVTTTDALASAVVDLLAVPLAAADPPTVASAERNEVT